MPSAPSKGLPPGYGPQWAGPRVVLPRQLPQVPRVVLPSQARVVPPPGTPPAFPPPPGTPPSSSSGGVPTSKLWRTVNDIVDELVPPTGAADELEAAEETARGLEEFDDFFEEVLMPPVKVEPTVLGVLGVSQPSRQIALGRGDALGQRNRDRLRDVGFIETIVTEPKLEAKEEEWASLNPIVFMAPSAKPAPPVRIKSELNEAPAKFAKRLRAVKEEVAEEAASSSSSHMATAVGIDP